MIHYDKKQMSLSIHIGNFHKFFQCPFATWWKCRKFFKRPKFKFYFGPMQKKYWWKGSEHIKPQWLWEDKGFFYFISYDYIKWKTSKWFPILVESRDVDWKDKYNSPRYEHPGYFSIVIGRNIHTAWQFAIVVKAPDFFCCNDCTIKDSVDNYWESMLWYLHYSDQYNPTNSERNLSLARKCFRNGHWSSSVKERIDDFKIEGYGTESVYLKEPILTYIDITSEKLNNIINKLTEYPKTKLKSDFKVFVYLKCESEDVNGIKIGKNFGETCTYTKLGADNIIRIFFNDHSRELLNRIENDNYSNIEISVIETIDLGPTFKDDFLNKNGIKEIQNYAKR